MSLQRPGDIYTIPEHAVVVLPKSYEVGTRNLSSRHSHSVYLVLKLLLL